jgi:hypothetical protein
MGGAACLWADGAICGSRGKQAAAQMANTFSNFILSSKTLT